MTADVLFSRSGNTNTFGKCTEEIKCMIDEETKEAMQALAFAHNLSLSEYTRVLLHQHCYGHARLLRNSMMTGG